MNNSESIKYKLFTLSLCEPTDIGNPEFEISYEDPDGNEHWSEVCCVRLAEESLQLIEDLQAKLEDQATYHFKRGNPTYFNHLLLGSSPDVLGKLTKGSNFDSSKMTVKLEINGIDVRVCDFNDVLEKWSDGIESRIVKKMKHLEKEGAVIEKAKTLLKEKLGHALSVLDGIENSSWKLGA